MVGIIADKTNLLTYGVHKQILILLQAILFWRNYILCRKHWW
jgi:hypothetical protein